MAYSRLKPTDPKPISGISGNSAEKNLTHSLTRLIAVSLEDCAGYRIRQYYQKLKFPLYTYDKDMETLVKQGILRLSCTSPYYNSNHYIIAPNQLFRVFKLMSKAEFEETMHQFSRANENLSSGWMVSLKAENLTGLVRGLYAYVNDDTEELKKQLPTINDAVTEAFETNNPSIIDLFEYFATDSKYAGFLNLLSPTAKIYLENEICDCSSRLHGFLFKDDVCGLFVKDGVCIASPIASLRFALTNKLFMTGNIDALIKSYQASDNATNKLVVNYLEAVKRLHQNEPLPLITLNIEMADKFGKEFLDYPEFAFLLLAATCLADSPTVANNVFRLLRNLDSYHASLLRAVLAWIRNKKIPNTNLNRLADDNFGYTNQIFFNFFARQLTMVLNNTSAANRDIKSNPFKNDTTFNYLRLNFAAQDSGNDSTVQALMDATGMTPLFHGSKKIDKWESMLDTINAELGVAKSSTGKVKGKAATRVAYLINLKGKSIRPIRQKTSDGNKWSTGQNIALSTFMAANEPAMTEQDIRVSRWIEESSYYYGSSSLYMPFNKCVAELGGHPYVFTDDDQRLKIEITEVPLQLSVTTTKKGDFQLKTIPDLNQFGNDNIYLNTDNPLSFSVTKITSQQVKLMHMLSEVKLLPAAAQDKLKLLLGGISNHMTVVSDLAGAETANSKSIESSSVITAQLVPEDDTVNAVLLSKPLLLAPPYLKPGLGAEYVTGVIDGQPVQTQRDLPKEARNFAQVQKMMNTAGMVADDMFRWTLSLEQTLELLEIAAANPEILCVEWPEGARFSLKNATLPSNALSIKVKNKNNWFDLEGELKIDENTVITLSALLEAVRNGTTGRFVRLTEDGYIALSKHLADTLKSLSRLTDKQGKKTGMSALHSDFIAELEKEGTELTLDRSTKTLMKNIEESRNAVIKMPKGIQADLREYQKDGYRWMSRLYMWGAGGILADDMGLGKTLQTICLLHAERKKGASLVVAPTSVLLNWRDELQRFAPTLNVKIINQLSDAEARKALINDAAPCDVVITSYGLLVNLQEELTAKEWNIIALDEAHTIKNANTKMSQAAMQLNGKMRLGLTGTPLQNRLSEVWNLFRFTNPGLLGSLNSFSERFIAPIERDSDRDRQKLLKRIISPFLLRRTKNDVLNELPPKTDIVVRVELSPEEMALYETMRRQAELEVQDGGNQAAFKALAEITKLRQASCHPKLVNPKLDLESSKTKAFMEIVENLHNNHHRALVFSQFTSHLALIREQLDKAGIPYLYLDGSTPAKERAKLVQEFQEGDVPLFLISLKAGGLGLNLTAADYVVHLDPWWNPAIEEQASDRSYRIGQTKPVTVYRLIAANTIEEKILRLHSHKKSLADALLEGSDVSARLTREEILALLSES